MKTPQSKEPLSTSKSVAEDLSRLGNAEASLSIEYPLKTMIDSSPRQTAQDKFLTRLQTDACRKTKLPPLQRLPEDKGLPIQNKFKAVPVAQRIEKSIVQHEARHAEQQALRFLQPTVSLQAIGDNLIQCYEEEEEELEYGYKPEKFELEADEKLTYGKTRYAVSKSGNAYLLLAQEIPIKHGAEIIARINLKAKILFITPELLATANAALEAKGSFIRLQGDDVNIFDKDLKRVTPIWNPDNPAIHYHNHAQDTSAQGGNFNMWADCGKASQAVTGSQRSDMSDRSVAYGNGDNRTTSRAERIAGLQSEDSKGTQFSNAMYVNFMKKFLQKKLEDQSLDGLTEKVHYFSGQVLRGKGGKARYVTEYRPIVENNGFSVFIKNKILAEGKALTSNIGKFVRWQYDKLAPAGKVDFDKKAGINRFADPQIGDSYLMNTEKNMPGFKSHAGQNTWDYHWAGVIIKDGSDNITLEGFSVNDRMVANDDWNFDMYAVPTNDDVQQGKTFHEKHLATKQHGKKATTMVVKTIK